MQSVIKTRLYIALNRHGLGTAIEVLKNGTFRIFLCSEGESSSLVCQDQDVPVTQSEFSDKSPNQASQLRCQKLATFFPSRKFFPLSHNLFQSQCAQIRTLTNIFKSFLTSPASSGFALGERNDGRHFKTIHMFFHEFPN